MTSRRSASTIASIADSTSDRETLRAVSSTLAWSAASADHANVEDTARKVSRSEVESAIDAIVDAERLLVIGTDQMAFFASYLRHLLMLLDLRAETVAGPSQESLTKL